MSSSGRFKNLIAAVNDILERLSAIAGEDRLDGDVEQVYGAVVEYRRNPTLGNYLNVCREFYVLVEKLQVSKQDNDTAGQIAVQCVRFVNLDLLIQ